MWGSGCQDRAAGRPFGTLDSAYDDDKNIPFVYIVKEPKKISH